MFISNESILCDRAKISVLGLLGCKARSALVQKCSYLLVKLVKTYVVKLRLFYGHRGIRNKRAFELSKYDFLTKNQPKIILLR